MKKILIVLTVILLISCNQKNKTNSESKNDKTEILSKTANFDWLIGKWKRTNEEQGKETFENWKKVDDSEYTGIGFTMQNGDTIKQEKIRLIKIDGKWDLKVKVPEETESTSFKMTEFSNIQFVCENNEIDFPNKIKYWKNGEKINASVSGADMEITFEFEKLNK